MPVSEITSSLSSKYKFKGKSDEARKERVKSMKERRKAVKDDQSFNNRIYTINVKEDDFYCFPSAESLTRYSTIREIADGMQANDEDVQLEATRVCRHLLSIDNDKDKIDEAINEGVVALCINFLEDNYSSWLQFEACWVLTNVASGTTEQTQFVITQGAIPLLVKLLDSPAPYVAKQAVWTLGNIADDSAETRDLILEEGALNSLISLITPDTPLSFMRVIAWTLSNLCKYKHAGSSMEFVEHVLPVIEALLAHEDKEIFDDTCEALLNLMDGLNKNIQTFLNLNVVIQLDKLLTSNKTSNISSILKNVENDAAEIPDNNSHGAMEYLAHLCIKTNPECVKKVAQIFDEVISAVKKNTAQK